MRQLGNIPIYYKRKLNALIIFISKANSNVSSLANYLFCMRIGGRYAIDTMLIQILFDKNQSPLHPSTYALKIVNYAHLTPTTTDLFKHLGRGRTFNFNVNQLIIGTMVHKYSLMVMWRGTEQYVAFITVEAM